MSFSDKAINYFCKLKSHEAVSSSVKIINPYESAGIKSIVRKFYSQYYNDNNDRIFIIGINPGRYGGGLTGISFTDPVALREHCRIKNNFGNRKELSSTFVYSVAKSFGGTKKFFSRIFLTALYPFAITKEGKNYNYYDEIPLFNLLRNEIVKNISKQVGFGASRELAVLLGKKNADYFLPINEEHKFFKRITVLEHPRYIMQYKLKQVDGYIKKYIDAINK